MTEEMTYEPAKDPLVIRQQNQLQVVSEGKPHPNHTIALCGTLQSARATCLCTANACGPWNPVEDWAKHHLRTGKKP